MTSGSDKPSSAAGNADHARSDAAVAARRQAVADGGVMSFGDHLEELRSCSIRALWGLALTTTLSLVFAKRVLAFILQPLMVVLEAHGQRPETQALSPPDTFVMYLKMALLSGLILAMPWVLIQIWRFVGVGLYSHERRFLRIFAPVSLGLFGAGVTFMFYVVLPVVLNFFVTFGEQIRVGDLRPNALQKWVVGTPQADTSGFEETLTPGAVPMLPADPQDPPPGSVWYNAGRNTLCIQTEQGRYTVVMRPEYGVAAVKSQFGLSFYISFVLMLMLAFGLAFELPLAVIFVTSMGLVSVHQLARSRRYVIFGIVIMAALITPPDVISQIMLAVPMVGLFEGALIASRIIIRRREAREDQPSEAA